MAFALAGPEPTEKFWWSLAHHLYSDDRQFKSVTELQNFIFEVCESTPRYLIKGFIEWKHKLTVEVLGRGDSLGITSANVLAVMFEKRDNCPCCLIFIISSKTIKRLRVRVYIRRYKRGAAFDCFRKRKVGLEYLLLIFRPGN